MTGGFDQAIRTLAAAATLGDATTAQVCAYAGVRPDLAASILRADPELIAEGSSPDHPVTWRVRDRDGLHASMNRTRGRRPEGPPDRSGVMHSDVAVAEQLCLMAHAVANDVTREVLARTALNLVGQLHPHARVQQWRARLTLLAPLTESTGRGSSDGSGDPAVDDPDVRMRGRARLVAVFATLAQALALGEDVGTMEIDAALRALSAYGNLGSEPVYRAFVDVLATLATTAAGDASPSADVEHALQRLMGDTAGDVGPAAGGSPSAMAVDPRLIALLQEYFEAPTWPESQRLVEQHPQLLSDEAEAAVQHVLRFMRERGEVRLAEGIERQMRPLRHARDVGIPAAFAEMMGGNGADGLETLVMGFVEAQTWAESRELLRRYPQLLGDVVLSALAVLIDRAGAEADLIALDVLVAHRDVLLRCREVGVDAAIAERAGPAPDRPKERAAVTDHSLLMATLFDFLGAGTPAQMLDYAAEHPLLLGPQAQTALASLVREANQDGRADLAFKLIECQRMLVQVRSDREGRPAPAAKDATSPVPAELGPLLRQIVALNGDDEAAQRAELLRRLIAQLDPNIHTDLWVSMQGMLGATLGDLAERDGTFDYEDAIAATLAALSRPAQGSDDVTVRAVNYHNLGKFYANRGTGDPAQNIDSAIEHFREALDAGEDLPEHLRTDALCELAGLYLDRGGAGREQDAEQAVDHASGALALLDRRKDALRWATASRLLGSAYVVRTRGVRRDNLVAALEHLHAALEVVDPEQHPIAWIAIQSSLGSAYREGALESAAETMERAVKHFQSALDVAQRQPSGRRRAAVLNGLGTAYMDRVHGDPAENIERAISLFESALEDCETVTERAAVIRNLASTHLRGARGAIDDHVESALSMLEDAATDLDEAVAPYEFAGLRLAVGNAYLARGKGARAHNIGDAIAAYTKAAGIFRRLGASREEAMCRLNLGNAHLRMVGDDEYHIHSAVGCLDAALAEFEAQHMTIEQAWTLDALGEAWSRRRDVAPAAMDTGIRYRATAIERLGSPVMSATTWEMVQSNLGAALLERGSDGQERDRELERAIACLEDALAIGAGRQLGPTGGSAMTQVNLGIAYRERAERGHVGDLATAISHLEAGHRAVAASGSRLQRRLSGKALGDAYSLTDNRWPDAVLVYGEAIDAADALYASALLRVERETELTESAGLRISAAYAAAMAGDVEQAVVWLERGRARGLGDAVARDRTDLEQIRSTHRSLVVEFEAAADQVRQVEAEDWRVAEYGHTSSMASNDALVRLRYQARERLNQAIEAIRGLDQHGSFLRQPELGDITRVACDVGPIAYLAVARTGCLTVLIAAHRGEGASVRLLPAPAGSLASESLRAAIIQDGGAGTHKGYLPEMVEGNFSGLSSALDELLPFLGSQLIHPLAQGLRESGEGRVTIVACGLLGLLPLHAAPYDRNGSLCTLIDEVDVSYAPSARVLGVARSRLARRSEDIAASFRPVLVGVGDPAGPSRLPYAQFETRAISQLFGEPRTFYGDGATKRALTAAASGATHVHLACHGRFDPNSPLDSAVLLAGGADYEPLTLREILRDRPFRDARLVVASACRTAVVDFLHLTDEVMGLPSGILQAGTPGVVGTLWPVDDLSTALLMIHFYECLVDVNGPQYGRPAAALRSAQSWLARLSVEELYTIVGRHRMSLPALGRDILAADPLASELWRRDRDQPGVPPYAHPYYWAPFVFIGV